MGDYVVLPREALFAFLVRDCAPMAARLSEWIDAHDLGDVGPGFVVAAVEP